MNIELSLLKDILFITSVLLNILFIVSKHPYKYLCNRYNGAQKRKREFYEPLIEDVNNLHKNLEEVEVPLRLRGLENKHLALTISNKTRLRIEELMKTLEESNRAYNDVRSYVFPQILNRYKEEVNEIERKYSVGLGIIKAGESFEFIKG